MKPGARHGKNLPRRFQGLLLQLARQAHNDLRRMPRHPDRAIHDLRVRMKKLAAILRLVKPRVPARTWRRILDSAKRLKDAFAAQRDAHVAGTLGLGLARGPTPPNCPAPLFDEASRLLTLLESATLEGLTRDEIRDAYVKTYRAGRRRMKACIDDPDPARLHAWRRPVKELYYQSLALHGVRGMKRRIRRARRLGRWLGRYHDWQLVIDRHPRQARRIEPKRARLRRRIFKVAAKLYASGPKRLSKRLS